jgi:hypothetical protein
MVVIISFPTSQNCALYSQLCLVNQANGRYFVKRKAGDFLPIFSSILLVAYIYILGVNNSVVKWAPDQLLLVLCQDHVSLK